MTPRHHQKLLALAASLVALGPRSAPAAEQRCPAMVIEPDAGFRARFPDLLARIHAELAARRDIDACAHVALRVQGEADIDVAVTLPDGRTASRNVARREDILPTLQALLFVPEPAPLVTAAAPSPPTKRPARPRPQIDPAEPSDRAAPPAAALAARRLGFELSAISGVRVGDGQLGYGAGLLSFLQIHSWLLGFEGRADGYRPIEGGDPQTALELAVLGGKRLDFGSVAFDLTAGPALAMKGVTLSDTQAVSVMGMSNSPPPIDSQRSSGPVPRLLLGARLGFSPRSVFRTFVGIDAELGPARTSADPEANVSSPRLPTFTLGLALGATVGTP